MLGVFSMRHDDKNPCPASTNPYAEVRLRLLVARLERERGNWGRISIENVRTVLAVNGGIPLPDIVKEYLDLYNAGSVGKPIGRPPKDRSVDHIVRVLAQHCYETYFRRLKQRNDTVGLAGWSATRDKPWWQGAPSERAARMTIAKLNSYAFPENYNNDWSTLRRKLSDWRHEEVLCPAGYPAVVPRNAGTPDFP